MNKFLDLFIHPRFFKEKHYLFRARALVGLQIFSSLIAIIQTLLEFFFIKIGIGNVLLIGSLVSLFSIFIFKKYGRIILSANLFAALCFGVFSYMTFDTGGLTSDNCMWIITTPIIGILFGNRGSGLIWLILIISFVLFLYFNNIYPSNLEDSALRSPLYYTNTYIWFYISVYFFCFIFKTEQNQVIDSILLRNLELEQKNKEIQLFNEKLKETSSKLIQSNKELEQFAYVASHDLKEPLRMITLYTQMIKKRLKIHLNDEVSEFMGYVTDGTKRMQQLLDDLLDYSRLGKKGSTAEVDLNDVLVVAQQNLRLLITTHHATINVTTLPKINATFSEIVQVFQNIIGNGIKFHKPDTNPIISISISEMNSKNFIIKINDNGIGIEEENFHKIFNLFERLHNRTKYEGTGIGLATCQKVVENLGGSIKVSSKLGEGSTFFISLPTNILSNN